MLTDGIMGRELSPEQIGTLIDMLARHTGVAIDVYYLGCGHVAWNIPVGQPVPGNFHCVTCHDDRVVVQWERRAARNGPNMG